MIIKELIKLANELDAKGLRKEADALDEIIRRADKKESTLLPSLVGDIKFPQGVTKQPDGSWAATNSKGETQHFPSEEEAKKWLIRTAPVAESPEGSVHENIA